MSANRGQREDALPRWAQSRLAGLRAEIRDLRLDRPAHEKQWAWLEQYGRDPIPMPISMYERITCVPHGADPTDLATPRISVRVEEDGALEIMCHDGPLAIYARSSNVIHVKADER